MTEPTLLPPRSALHARLDVDLSKAAPFVVVGADGMLGQSMLRLLRDHGLAYTAVDRPAFDLTRDDHVSATLGAGVRTVVNCAAWTNVDEAEKQEAAATAVNGDGVGRLARRCVAIGATFLHFGTDYVFSGDASSPYRVDAPLQPLGAYGRSKALGEELLRASGADYLQVRTSWLYAPWGNNFVRTIARFASEKPELRVVSDQRGRPTSAEHLARTTLRLLARGVRGTQHVTDGGECTWFDFATRIAARVAPACRVVACTSAEYPRPAKRPAYSVLDISGTEAQLGPMPPWEQNLDDVLARLPEATR